MKYLIIGLVISIGWHIGKLIYELVNEVIFTRLHATEWYAILCKKQPAPIIPMKKHQEPAAYKETTIGFKINAIQED